MAGKVISELTADRELNKKSKESSNKLGKGQNNYIMMMNILTISTTIPILLVTVDNYSQVK